MQRIKKKLLSSESAAFRQFVKYVIAGVAATVTHIIIFFLFSWLVLPALNTEDIIVRLFNLPAPELSDSIRARNAMINNGIAFIISNFTAYILNITWVFEAGRQHTYVNYALRRSGLSAHPFLCAIIHRSVEIGFFYLASGIAIAIGTLMMWTLIDLLGLTTTVAFGAQCIAAVLINFAARKFIIFKK